MASDSTTDYKEVIGRTFKPRLPKVGQKQDKRYLGIRSLATGKIVNVTVWDNSHGHVEIEEGDLVYAAGKFSRNEGSDGQMYNNISAYEIAVISTDKGKRKDDEGSSSASDDDDDDAPGVM